MSEVLSESEEIAGWLRRHAQPQAQLQIDSRRIEAGDIFVALKGTRVDAMSFAATAVAHGASAILTEKRDASVVLPVSVLEVDGLNQKLGSIAAHFYATPSAAMLGVAVTGTNGKTSTSHWMSSLLTQNGIDCAAIGTNGCFLRDQQIPVPALTTPDAISLQRLLKELSMCGAKAFAIEASSIGLDQGRLNGTDIHTAIFTNLTRDHLDYHGSFEQYESAKKILFSWPGLQCAVINTDDPCGRRFAQYSLSRGIRVICVGIGQGEHLAQAESLRATDLACTACGMRFTVHYKNYCRELQTHVLGRFNVMNLLGVAAAGISLGLDPELVFDEIQMLTPPKGRLQMAVSEHCPLGVVDYAHTPDALEKAILALREVAGVRAGKLKVIFGAGGDRDRGKRPLMGQVAQALADVCVVTSDNPRSEDPEAIVADILEGMQQSENVTVITDRKEAILKTIFDSDVRDVVLVAGKGHEDYQEIQGIKHHFSDMEILLEAFNECHVRAERERIENGAV